VIAGLLVVGIVAAAAWIASTFDAPIALWVVVLLGATVFAAGVFLGRTKRWSEDLHAYQADLIKEAILALRDVAAGHLDISFEEFIERGVLAPARFGLSLVSNEEIRLSVLKFDESAQTFQMIYESGHSLGRKNNFSLPKTSIAGHALESGDLQWTNNVDGDKRWSPHPLANNDRRYGSLASMPIIVGNEPVAVLNVVSSHKGAFLTGDLTYIELLGGFIGLAWALNDDAGSSHRLDTSEESNATERKGT
ncbi:MAG TPA: GAF domain-containing protein, partial [Solirubrobacterales bacterium]|nr:GAF domain-containing protein [Solirubrobacterales bacterium]